MRRVFVTVAVVVLAAEWGLTSAMESEGVPGSTMATALKLAVGVVALLGIFAVALEKPRQAEAGSQQEKTQAVEKR
jgi:hypothetical protein